MNDKLLPQPGDASPPVLGARADDGEQHAIPAHALSQALDRLGVAMGLRDPRSGRYVRVNARMAELLGDDVDPHGQLRSGAAQWNPVRAADQAALARGETIAPAVEHRIERGGERREFLVSRTVLAATAGGEPLVCSLWVDCTAERRREASLQLALDQLEKQQRTNEALRSQVAGATGREPVSGLSQATHFHDQLRREIDLSSREHREFALVWVTLDPLPEATATKGPAARERILDALGALLRSNTRAMDAACRLEDGRFGVLLSGVGLATAHARMEGLRRQCATHIVVLDGEALSFSVSMGVASFPHSAHQEAELIRATDRALLDAQRRGGNQIALATIPLEGE